MNDKKNMIQKLEASFLPVLENRYEGREKGIQSLIALIFPTCENI